MTESKGSKPVKVAFDVVGMTCGGCSGKVQRALLELDGVTYALVSHERNEAIVRFAPDRLTADDLRGVIEGVGYEASVRL